MHALRGAVGVLSHLRGSLGVRCGGLTSLQAPRTPLRASWGGSDVPGGDLGGFLGVPGIPWEVVLGFHWASLGCLGPQREAHASEGLVCASHVGLNTLSGGSGERPGMAQAVEEVRCADLWGPSPGQGGRVSVTLSVTLRSHFGHTSVTPQSMGRMLYFH